MKDGVDMSSVSLSTEPVDQETFFARWRGPLGLSLTLFTTTFNIVLLQIIMSALVHDLDTTVSFVQAALIVLSLVTMAFIPTSDNLSRRFGRKNLLMLGLGIHALGVVLCASSQTMGGLALSYAFVLGIAATAMISTPWALLAERYDGPRRDRVQIMLSVGAALGVVGAQVLGGFFATGPGWRWGFVFQILLVLLTMWLLHNQVESEKQANIFVDWGGGLLALLGLGALLSGLSLGGSYGWWLPSRPFEVLGIVIQPLSLSITPYLLGGGAIALATFVYWQRRRLRRGQPMMFRVGLLNQRTFLVGVITALLFAVVYSGFNFDLYLFVPVAMKVDSFQVALALLPLSLSNVFASIFALPLSNRLSPKYLVQIGLVLMLLGFVWFIASLRVGITALEAAPSFVLVGLGSGLVMALAGSLAISLVRGEESGEASGIFNTLQNLGNSLGRSIIGVLLVSTASITIVDSVLQTVGLETTPEERQAIIVEFEEAVITLSREDFRAEVAQLSEPVQAALAEVGDGAAMVGMRVATLACVVITVLAFAVAWFLPRRDPETTDQQSLSVATE